LSQIVDIAQDIGLQVPEDEEINKEKNYFNAFCDYCKEYGSKVLLIIDNVEDPRSLNDGKILFPSDLNTTFRILELECNIIFTTRRDFVLPGTRMRNINLLSPESSLALLTKYRKPTTHYQQQENEEKKYSEKICNSVGYLPLALVLIQAYLRKYQDVSFKEYYEEVVKSKMGSIDLDEVSEDQLSTRHSPAIRVTLDQDWKVLEERNEDQNQIQKKQNAKKLLSLLSLLQESALVPKGRLIILSGIDRFGKTKLIRPADSAFNVLDELNLIDVSQDGKSVRIHPLLREYMLEKLEGDGAENQTQTTTLKAESILNLKRAYYDNFSSLVQEYVERNSDIDSIREDFETVLLWSKEPELVNLASSLKIVESELYPIYELNKIINQEQHNLRLSVTNDSLSVNQDMQVLFAQSVLIRSFDLNNMEMANKAREFLLQVKKPFLDIRWARVRDKGALIRTLEGHSYSVTSVAITSDDSKIVSGSWDKTIKIWDLNTGELLKTLKGHSDSVSSVAITSDDSKIVSGSIDNTIKVWDLNSGELLNTLERHYSTVNSMAISSDNSKIVSGSGDNTIKVWDLNSGELLNTLEDHSGYVLNTLEGYSVAITSDDSKIVSGVDKIIKVWDLNSGELLNTLEGHSSSVNSVAITSDNSKIVSGSWDKTIKVWDLHQGKYYLSNKFDASISSIAFSKSKNLMALGDSNGNLYAGALYV